MGGLIEGESTRTCGAYAIEATCHAPTVRTSVCPSGKVCVCGGRTTDGRSLSKAFCHNTCSSRSVWS